VWVAVHPTLLGHVYVLASVWHYGDPADVMFIRSADGGLTWSRAVRVNDDLGNEAHQWFGTLSVAPNGRLDATWNDTRGSTDAHVSAVYYAHSLDEGRSWSPNEQVSPQFNSHVGFPNQRKMGDYAHQVSDDFGVNLAYAATFNNEQDIYFLRAAQDCNANGILDECDLSCGAPSGPCNLQGCGLSPDCNQNRVPDDCEPLFDCNNNQIFDICDIAAAPTLDCDSDGRIDYCDGFSDCNLNGVPDRCDIFLHGDCDGDGGPDDCEAAYPGADRNQDSVPDWCQGACCDCSGCENIDAFECYFRDGTFSDYTVLCGDPGACVTTYYAHDQCSSAFDIPSAPDFLVGFDNRCTSDDGPATVPCSSDQPMGADLWYTYRAPCDGQVRFDTCDGTFFDGMLAVYDGGSTCSCPFSNAGLVACGDDTCGFGGGPAIVEVDVVAGRCYVIRVGGWAGARGVGTLAIDYLTACNRTDLDGDSDTDLADFAQFQSCFGSTGAKCATSDFDGDGIVGPADFVVFFSALVN
jgi:hypothetical protein